MLSLSRGYTPSVCDVYLCAELPSQHCYHLLGRLGLGRRECLEAHSTPEAGPASRPSRRICYHVCIQWTCPAATDEDLQH